MRQGSPREPLRTDVGFIGLGVMGKPMARNLLRLRDQRRITIFDRRKERVAELLDLGARWAESPRELASQSQVIMLMLPDLPQVDEVLSGPDGLLAGITAPTVLVISSTSSASGVRTLATRVAADTGGLATVVDAPVSGGEEGAVAGTLSIMVGGASADVATALPVLNTMGTAVHLGPLGSGEIAKFCNQLIVASTIMALGEAAVIAERSGLEIGPLFELLQGGYAGSRVLETRKDRIVSGEYGSSGLAKYMVKDLTFALDEATATGAATPQLETLLASFTALTQAGFGDQDISVTRAFVESQSTTR